MVAGWCWAQAILVDGTRVSSFSVGYNFRFLDGVVYIWISETNWAAGWFIRIMILIMIMVGHKLKSNTTGGSIIFYTNYTSSRFWPLLKWCCYRRNMSHVRSFGSLKFCCPFFGAIHLRYVFVRNQKITLLCLHETNTFQMKAIQNSGYLRSSLTYCWWFRNPANPVELEVGSLSTIIYMVLYILGGHRRIFWTINMFGRCEILITWPRP